MNRFYIFAEKKRKMGKNKKCLEIVKLIVCLLAIVLSIIAISRTCYRTVELGFDYLGIIVGVLAILVTFLVGWNIYSVVDTNNKTKEMKSEIDTLKTILGHQSDEVAMQLHRNQGKLYHTTVSIEEKLICLDETSIYTDMLFNMVCAIDSFSKAGNFVQADIYLSCYHITINSNLNKFQNNIETSSKSSILELLFEIPNKNKLSNYAKFRDVVVKVCQN